jgi:hypothetical protein
MSGATLRQVRDPICHFRLSPHPVGTVKTRLFRASAFSHISTTSFAERKRPVITSEPPGFWLIACMKSASMP